MQCLSFINEVNAKYDHVFFRLVDTGRIIEKSDGQKSMLFFVNDASNYEDQKQLTRFLAPLNAANELDVVMAKRKIINKLDSYANSEGEVMDCLKRDHFSTNPLRYFESNSFKGSNVSITNFVNRMFLNDDGFFHCQLFQGLYSDSSLFKYLIFDRDVADECLSVIMH